ncbi:unnamed protein product [Mytilus coruscus]|uniref:Uncharacterized protein n=1 Tax=Mytilus coruscus TaxID=42192 RepID=A0A6J8BKT3_MYTCO|nr:unnamed protein product [Mytilus coruscus]
MLKRVKDVKEQFIVAQNSVLRASGCIFEDPDEFIKRRNSRSNNNTEEILRANIHEIGLEYGTPTPMDVECITIETIRIPAEVAKPAATSGLILSSNLMIRIKITTAIENRKDQYLTYVIENVNKDIRPMYFTEKCLSKLKQDCFYAITNAKIGSAINVGQYSKVMERKPFDYDANVEKAFIDPPVTSVAEALASPQEEVYENEYSKRRILNISGNGATIAVKLWGNKSDMQMPEKKKKNNITIHGLEKAK